jgi:transcriptional regulator with XRE-family HTH domain
VIEFSKKNIAIKTLGERLRGIREKAGVSIEEIAKVTKVNKKYLEYIEADDYDNLPSDVYVKGFLRNYSNFLGIEAKDVLRIYKKERGIQVNIKKPKAQDSKKKKIKIPTIILPLRVVASIFMGVFFVAIAWYFYIETGKFSEAPRLLLSSPVDSAIVTENSTEVVGVTDIGNRVVINGQAIFVNEKGEFREKVSLREGINKLVIKSTNKFDKEIEREINLSAQYKKELPDNNEVSEDSETGEVEQIDNKVRLFVKAANGPVWIAIKIDGVKDYSGTMLKGTEQEFEGNSEIAITSGMANQTFIKINKEEDYYELADNAGVIRDVVFKNKNNLQEKDNQGLEGEASVAPDDKSEFEIESGEDSQ